MGTFDELGEDIKLLDDLNLPVIGEMSSYMILN
jgi:hypothetical protein